MQGAQIPVIDKLQEVIIGPIWRIASAISVFSMKVAGEEQSFYAPNASARKFVATVRTPALQLG
jgi:hypothetical protein